MKDKPKIIVRDSGQMVVDLETLPDETFREMKKTAEVLRRSKKRKTE